MTLVLWKDRKPVNGLAAVRWLAILALVLTLAVPPAWGQPSITYITPSTGPNTGGFDLDIHGTNLITDEKVYIIDGILGPDGPFRNLDKMKRGECTVLHEEPNLLKVRLPSPDLADRWDDRDRVFQLPGTSHGYPICNYHVLVEISGSFSRQNENSAIIFEDDHPRYRGSYLPRNGQPGYSSLFERLRAVLKRPRDQLADSPVWSLAGFHSHRWFFGSDALPETEDEDAFIIFGRKDQVFTVECYGVDDDSPASPKPDTRLEVLDYAGNVLTRRNDPLDPLGVDLSIPDRIDDIRTPLEVEKGPVNRNARWTFTASANADYYAIASSFGAESSPYRIRVRRDEHPERPQETMTVFDKLPTMTLKTWSGDSASGTTSVVTTSAFIDFLGDQDAYEMLVTTGTVYRIETALVGQTLVDSTLRLYTKDGNVTQDGSRSGLIEFNDDRGPLVPSSMITYVSSKDELLKLVVGGNSAPSDPYPLSYRLEIRAERQAILESVAPQEADNRGGSRVTTLSISGYYLASTTSAYLADTVNPNNIREASIVPGSITTSSVRIVIPDQEPPNLFEPRVWSVHVRGSLGVSPARAAAAIKFFDDRYDDLLNVKSQNRETDNLTPDSSQPGGKTTDAAIGYRGDRDFFRLTAEANTTYQLETILGGTFNLPRSAISLFSTTGAAITTGYDSVIFTTYTTETRYFAVAGATLNHTGSYRLRVRVRKTPTISQIAPVLGLNSGGFDVAFSGTNYTNTTSVVMLDAGGKQVVSLSDIVVLGDRSMTARLPIRYAGSRYLPGSYSFKITNDRESGVTPPGLLLTLRDDHPAELIYVGAGDTLAAPLGASLSTISADIGYPGDLDFFKFRADGGAIYLLTTRLLGLGNSRLTLFSSSGAIITSATDLSADGVARIEYVVPPERANRDHYLSVQGLPPTSVGTYAIDLRLDDHPSDFLLIRGSDMGIGGADYVPSDGTVVNAAIQAPGDVDVFVFTEALDTPYLIETVLPGDPTDLTGTSLELIGLNGAVLSRVLSTAAGEPSRITTVGDERTSGVNYLRVRGLGAASSGTYGIRVSVAPIPVVTDVCVSPGVCPIAGDPVVSNAGGFGLTIVGINLTGAVSVGLSEASSVVVPVEPGGTASRIGASVPVRPMGQYLQPGTYHVRVLNNLNNFSPATDRSVVRLVDDHPELAASVGVADTLSVGGAALAGAIGFPGDVDCFRFAATGGVVYIVEVQRGSLGNAGQLTVQASSGGVAVAGSVSLGATSVFITLKAPAAANMELAVRGEGNTRTGDYTIRVFQATRPSVTALTPSRVLNDRATPLAISGSGFLGATQVALETPPGTLLAAPTVVGDRTALTTVPPGVTPGYYGVYITTSLGANTGGPKLHVDDHPNTIAETGPDAPIAPRDLVPINRPPSPGTLELASDRDVFIFPVQPFHTYTVQTNLVTLNDTYLTVVARDGTTVMGENDNLDTAGGAYNSRVTFTAMEAATYYARVHTLGATGGTYGLSVSDPGAPDDHANLASATVSPGDLLSEGVSAAAAIEYPGDVDFFSFQAVAGAVYDLETTLGTVSDTVLTVFDRDGTTVLAENDDNPELATSRASKVAGFQPRATGTYYARVRHFSPELASASGSYTLLLSRRPASLAVLQVRAPRASVSRGQVLTLEVEVQNTGSRPLTALSAGPDFTLGGRSSAADYAVSAQAGNVTSLSAGQNATFRYRVAVSGAAALGLTAVGAHAGGRDGAATVSSPPAFVTTRWTVQTPAAASILTFQALPQVSRGQTTTVTMVVSNAGQASVAIEQASLRFVGSNGSSRDGDFTVVPSPSNPVVLVGSTGGATPVPGRTYLAFSVGVKSTATTETVAINGTFRGRELNSDVVMVDDSASTPVQWTVQTAASLLIAAVQAPASVSRGQTARVVLHFENPGQSSATLLVAALRFLSEAGGDLGAQYQARVAPGAALTVPAHGTLDVPFDVTVGEAASLAPVLVDGLATARDDRTGGAISLLRSAAPAWWTVQAPAVLAVTRVQASPAQLARGGSITLTLTVENHGAAAANLSALGFQLLSLASGLDRLPLFTLTPAGLLPTVLAGGATVAVTFTAAAGPLAPFEQVRVSGVVSGTDSNSGARLSAASSAAADPLISVLDVLLAIVAPLSSAVLYPDEAVVFRASLRTRAGVAVPGASYLWRSNVSGQMGAGEVLPARLATGTHQVSVTASAGAAINLTTAAPFMILGLPAPVNTLSVSGAAVRTQAMTPLGDGFRVTLRNATRGLTAETVTSGGRYSVTLSSPSGAAAAGDVLTAQLREPEGLRRPTSPDHVTLLARDLVAGSRTLDLAAGDLVEGLSTLSRGLNLMAIPISPATTDGAGFGARELALATRSPFVVRLTAAADGRSRSEGYLASQPSGGFLIRGNEGYLVSSPADQLVRFRGTPWPASQLYRLLPRGPSFVALPLGTPAGLRSDELLQRAQGATAAGRLATDGSGSARFELHLPDVTAPFDLLPGRGYLLNLPAGGDVLLPAAP